MALAPYAVTRTVIGQFTERERGKHFEYDRLSDSLEHPYRVWVTTPWQGIDSGWRYAKVLKTAVHIVVDEDENGFVIEKWSIKNHSIYVR
jgi:hypothetical protein